MENDSNTETTPIETPADNTCESKLARAREVATDNIRQARDFAAAKVNQIRMAASAQAGHIREFAREKGGLACDKAKELHQAGEEYVKANPTKSVLIALGVGFVIGLVSRGFRR